MKWIGLASFALGALLALDGGNWYIPVTLGTASFAVWYLLGRDGPHVEPDESDWLRRNEKPLNFQESSTEFDLPDLEHFLRRIAPHISKGFADRQIAFLADLARRMKQEEERSFEYQVVFQGQHTVLYIGLFKDDLEAIAIYFLSVRGLTEIIDSEMDAFFEEGGM